MHAWNLTYRMLSSGPCKPFGKHPPTRSFDTPPRSLETSLYPLRYTFSQHPLILSRFYKLGGSSIDRIDEKIPKTSWETINNASAPVSGLFFPDTAYTLRDWGHQRPTWTVEDYPYFSVINI
jgi:hypothetical protein